MPVKLKILKSNDLSTSDIDIYGYLDYPSDEKVHYDEFKWARYKYKQSDGK